MAKLETGSYKGVRDFYPEDQSVQTYIFDIWRKTMESFGYVEYGASILEPAELYKEKSGEEIVEKQTYTFKDRGERDVTLRPEMTPTVARLVAQKRRELGFPLRWYSIPNLFRYEAPQRGRLREHWQLNADLFGLESIQADVELIEIAYRIMRNFGASDDDFIIRLNSRRIIDRLYALFDLSKESSTSLSKLIDKKQKISEEEFNQSVEKILGDKSSRFLELINSPEETFNTLGRDSKEIEEIFAVSHALEALGITNITFDQTLMRGFDYYTGVVFELFDTNKENPRSILGGGRYDDLLSIFEEEKVTAVGFGAGDVTIRDFLETHRLLPELKPTTHLYIVTLPEVNPAHVENVANTLRQNGLNVAVDWSKRKVGDQIKTAEKHGIQFVIVIGEDEIKNSIFKIKDLKTGIETSVPLDRVNLVIFQK